MSHKAVLQGGAAHGNAVNWQMDITTLPSFDKLRMRVGVELPHPEAMRSIGTRRMGVLFPLIPAKAGISVLDHETPTCAG